MGTGRWLIGMELARARARAARDPGGRQAALVRAGDAYESARRAARGPGGEASRPGAAEAVWRGLGRALSTGLALAPGPLRRLEDRLLQDLPERGAAPSPESAERSRG